MSKVNFLSGLSADAENTAGLNVESPQEDINKYDSGMPEEFTLADLSSIITQQEANQNRLEVQARQQAQQQILQRDTQPIRELQRGLVEDQEFASPDAVIGSFRSDVSRSFVAGWGDLVEGTGNSYDFLTSLITPWEAKVETSIGNWLRDTGKKIQNNNAVYADASLDEVSWADLANEEFWSTKVARLLPYALSFIVPYATGARIGGKLLIGAAGRYGKLGKGLKGYEFKTKGSGVLGKLAFDAGTKGVQLTKAGKLSSGLIGGGMTANLTEGAYVAGEALREAKEKGLGDKAAESIAANVYLDNMKWMAFDIVQFGIAFGGLGRVTAGLTKFGADKKSFLAKISPILANTTGLAAVEGGFEQYQEVYQEWIKRKAIAENEGDDFMSYSEFFASPEMKETRVSAFALGAVMGAQGGFIDAQAERSYQLEEKKKKANNIIGGDNELGELKYTEKALAESIIDHNGSGDYARAFLADQLSNNRISQETHDTYLQAVEKYEEIYNRYNVEENLMDNAKAEIFREQLYIEEQKAQLEVLKESKEEAIKNANEIFKNDPKGLQERLEQIEEEFGEVAENAIRKNIATSESRIANIYKLKRKKLTKKGVPKKSSTGLSQEEYEKFSKKEVEKKQQEKADRPGLLRRAVGAIKGAAGKVKEVVTSPKETAQKISDELKSAATTFKNSAFAKKQGQNLKNIMSKAGGIVDAAIDKSKMTLSEAQAAAVAAVKASDIKGKTKALYDYVRQFVKNKYDNDSDVSMEETIDAEFQDVTEMETIDMTDPQNITVSSEEVLEELKKRNEDDVYTKEQYKEVEKELKQKKAEENKQKQKESKEDVKKKDQIKVEDSKESLIKRIGNKVYDTLYSTASKTKAAVVALFDNVKYKAAGEYSEAQFKLDKYNYVKVALRDHINKKFPNKNIVVVEEEFLDSFGFKQTSLVMSSVVLVTTNEALQTGLIHELGHPYYKINKDTAFIKALNKLLVKTDLYQTIKDNYPDYVMFKFGKAKLTAGEIYYELRDNINYANDSDLKNIINRITNAKNEKDMLQAYFAFNKFIVDNNIAKELPQLQQEGLLEEVFATTLERYAKDGINSILPNKKDAQQFENEIQKMWKSTKKGAPTEEEAKQLLTIAVPQTKDMTLENAFKYVLANLSDNSIVPKVTNSKKGKQINYKRKLFKRISYQSQLEKIIDKYKNEKVSDKVKLINITRELYEELGAPDIDEATQKLIQNHIQARLEQKKISDTIDVLLELEDTVIEETEDIGINYDDKNWSDSKKYRDILNAYSKSRSTPDNLVKLNKLRKEFLLITFRNKAASPAEFAQEVRNSDVEIVQDFVAFLEESKQHKDRVNSILEGFGINYSGLVIERFFNFDHTSKGIVGKSMLSSIEKRWIDSSVKAAQKAQGTKNQNPQFHKDIEQMLKKDITPDEAIAIIQKVFAGVDELNHLDLDTIKTQKINYKTQGLRYVHEILNDKRNKKQFYNNTYGVQFLSGFKDVYRGILENSRLENQVIGIQDVNNNRVSILNKESSIYKTINNLKQEYKNNPGEFIKNYDTENNFIYNSIINNVDVDLLQSGGLFSNITNKKASYDQLQTTEKLIIELLGFVKAEDFYLQSIGTLADSKRSYYVLTPKLNKKEIKQQFDKFIELGYDKYTYQDGSPVVNLDEITQTIDIIDKIQRSEFKNLAKGTTRDEIRQYVVNSIIQKFYIQQALIGDHRFFKNEKDYVKRAKGASAMHTQPFKDTPIEVLVYEDIGIETDGGGYITQEQAKHINNSFSDVIDVGEVYKFVYYNIETNNKNKNIYKRPTYLKFNVQTITLEEEEKNPVLKKIADDIRARQKIIADSQGIDADHSHLVIATFESGAKAYNKNFIHNIDDSIDTINEKQNELYYDGDINTDTYKWTGIDGNGLGIQVELDRLRQSRSLGSQVLPNILPGVISESNIELMTEIYENVIADLVESLENNSTNIIKNNNELNNKDKQQIITLLEKEKNELAGNITEEGFGLENVELSKIASRHLPILYNKIKKIYNNRISKDGGMLETPGSIGIQGASAGYNLNHFKTVNELIELNEDTDYAEQLEILVKQGKGDYVVSEAIVPNYYKTGKMKMKKGTLFLGSRIPIHGPPSNVVFIVKDFHSKGKKYDNGSQSPRSIITIPSEISKIMGSDLDGDAIYVQTQYPSEFTEYVGVDPVLSPKKQRVNKILDNIYKIYSSEEYKMRREKAIDFEKEVDAILVDLEKKNKTKRNSQLNPLGDSQYYNDNIPAKKSIGTLASLNKTLNIVAHTNVKLENPITLGNKTIDRIQDNNDMSWFVVAQALNIALDNAKHQQAYRLGLTPQTAAHFAILLRMGFDLKTVAEFYNSEDVKNYFKNKEKNNTTEKDTVEKQKIPVNPEVESILENLNNINKELIVITQAVDFYKNINENSYVVESLLENIKAETKALNNSDMDRVKNNPLVKHSENMLQRSLTKSYATDFMRTGESQRFMEMLDKYINYTKFTDIPKLEKIIKTYQVLKIGQIINAEYEGLLSNEIEFNDAFGNNNKTLYTEFLKIKTNNPDNKFLNELLTVQSDEQSGKAINIRLNPKVVNKDIINESAIAYYKSQFNKLSKEEQELILKIEFLQNGLGFYNQSFLPFMSTDMVSRISNAVDNYFVDKKIEGVDYNIEQVKKDLVVVMSKNAEALTDKQTNNLFESSYYKKLNKTKLFETKNDLMSHAQNKTPRTNTNYKRNLYFGNKDSEYSKLKSKLTFKQWSEGHQGTRADYNKYSEDYDDMKSFEEQWIDTGKLETLSFKELYFLHDRYSNLSNGTNDTAIQQIKDVMARKAFITQSKKIKQAAQKAGMDVKDPKDMTTIQKWFGANNIPHTNPDIQFLINTLEQQYKEYVIENKKYADRINKAANDLHQSKKRELRFIINPSQRNKILYGNMITQTQNGLELRDRKRFLTTNPSAEQIAFYDLLVEITGEFSKFLPENKRRKNYIPHVTSGVMEAMGARGLFGLYAYYTGSESDIARVKVFGVNENGNEVLMAYGDWKQYYGERNNKIDLPSGRAIKDLYKLKLKAKKFAKLGQNEDGSALDISSMEADSLVGGEAFNRFTARRTVRAKMIPTFDLGKALKEYVKASLFVKGNDNFIGFHYTTPLIDAVIEYNQSKGNKNAAQYLTKVWKENFLQNKKPVGVLGEGVDKYVDGFVKLTSLIQLGMNPFVATGNILAGKYQELRKRGGNQFILGEKRYWRDVDKTKEILSKYRVIEYSIDELVESTNAIDKAAFWFMDISEKWIQGAAFLGELTEQEFNSGIISDERVNEINAKIATVHGEGYTRIDQRYLQLYSLGRAVLQFKRWFVTYLFDRFSAEEINRFGQHTIGSYTAGSVAAKKVFNMIIDRGKFGRQEVLDSYNDLSEVEKEELKVLLRGAGISMITLLLATSFMKDDDDDNKAIGKFLYGAYGDMTVVTDYKRHINYTLTPAAWSTQQNTVRFIKDVVSAERATKESRYLQKGDYRAKSSLLKIIPFKYPISQLVEYENRMETETN